jgi:hypothetical protein
LLLILSLIGCNGPKFNQPKSGNEIDKTEFVKLDGKIVISATVSKIGENVNDVKDPYISFGKENNLELQSFVDAINKAKKVNGVVDVAVPDFLLTITFDDKTTSKYFFWLHSDSGSIMNEKDTHTIYNIPSHIIKDLKKYVN